MTALLQPGRAGFAEVASFRDLGVFLVAFGLCLLAALHHLVDDGADERHADDDGDGQDQRGPFKCMTKSLVDNSVRNVLLLYQNWSSHLTQPKQTFGSAATELKLRKLAEYLDRYTTALQFQPSKSSPFRKIYFDAFAGNGGVDIQSTEAPLFPVVESSTFIEGSARRALNLRLPFDEYIFVEKSKARAEELQAIVDREYPQQAKRVKVICGDANDALKKFCSSTNWHGSGRTQARAVVFLDPFGNAVDFDTVRAIAATKAIDLWYLFPAGWGVNRQIRNVDGDVHSTHERSLDRIFGTGEWRLLAKRETGQLSFDQIQRTDYVKIASPKSMTEFMIARMKAVFQGGVLDEWLPLGAKGRHDYSLIFAWANPSDRAKLAAKLAEGVLKSKRRGRSK